MLNRFSERIKRAKREILNLKTAYDRGLGTTVFFYRLARWTPSDSASHTIRIEAVFQNPKASGITQMGLPLTPGFTFGALVNVNSYPGGAYIDLTASCTDAYADFGIVSSEGFSSLTVTELT